MDEFRLSAKDLEEAIDVEIVPNGQALLPARQSSGQMQVKARYTTAMVVQERRSLRVVEARLKDEASLLGAAAYYSWKGEGDSKSGLVEGGSIDLAMVVARAWGNCVTDQSDVIETPEAWFFDAYFIDLETGYTTNRKFRQSRKHLVYGKMDEARKEQIRFEIGQSKAIRNVTLKAMPKWLINMAIEYAKQGVKLGIQRYINEHGIQAARTIILKRLSQYHVNEAMVLEKMDRETIQGLTIEDLVILQGDVKALENGEETVGSIFGSDQGTATAQPHQSRTEQAKEQLKQRQTKQARKPEEPVYATLEQAQELLSLAEERGATDDLSKMFAHTDPDKLTVKQYEDAKASLLKRPLLMPATEPPASRELTTDMPGVYGESLTTEQPD